MTAIQRLTKVVLVMRIVSAVLLVGMAVLAWLEPSTPKGWLFIGSSLASWVVYDVLESVKRWATLQPRKSHEEP